jgi:translation initiation factor IF-2
MNPENKQIQISSIVTVKQLAEAFDVPVTVVIKQLLSNGVLATINDNIDFETAAIIADDLGYEVSQIQDASVTAAEEMMSQRKSREGADTRPPVVTVLGHVDHGKTSLLDYIRKTKVAAGESGGITQHMGAYQVDYKGRKVTFLDTPGHEAFSAIRAQGTKVTDVAILIVAGDEGIKPQTIEAIELIHAAQVPMVVAVTKIDKPESNLLRVEQELAAHNIVTERWGGKDVVVGVSSKTGEGVDDLLELVLLTADMQNLRSDEDAPATGVIIEAKHDPRVGFSATVLVDNGTLHVGDAFVASLQAGKVKSMEDFTGKRVKEAGPSMPVRITGFSIAPAPGDIFEVMESDKAAKERVAQKTKRATARKAAVNSSDLSKLSAQIRAARLSNLNIVLKADAEGSLAAIRAQLEHIKTDKGLIRIVGEGIGNISESDVLSAVGEKAFVIGFKVDVTAPAKSIAKKDDVKILTYDVIYNLTDDLARILLDSIAPERVEIDAGKATVLKIFRDTKDEKIIGMKVLSGRIVAGNTVRFSRENEPNFAEGTVKAIKHLTDELKEALPGNELGFLIKTTAKGILEGDSAEFVKVEMKKASLL